MFLLQGMELGLRKLAEKIRTEEQQLDMGVPAMAGSDDDFEGEHLFKDEGAWLTHLYSS